MLKKALYLDRSSDTNHIRIFLTHKILSVNFLVQSIIFLPMMSARYRDLSKTDCVFLMLSVGGAPTLLAY